MPIDPSVQDGNTFAAKLSAILGARDVPDLLSAPSWEVDKIPRFAQAVKALFEDLTDYLRGDAVAAYPMLATLPTAAWQYSVWGGRLAAVPYPHRRSVPLGALLPERSHRQGGCRSAEDDRRALPVREEDDERRQGRLGVRQRLSHGADVLQVRAPHTGWRKKPGGGLEHKYETKEYRQAARVHGAPLQGRLGASRRHRDERRRLEDALQRRQDAS